MNKLFFLLYFATLTVTFDLNLNVDTLTTTQGIYIKGSGDSFAGNLAVIGDINADGLDDFIISAKTESSVGAVFIIFGSSTKLRNNIDLSALASLSANNLGFKILGVSGGSFGHSVSGLGDVNGDNIDDFIVGNRDAYSTKGAVYIIFGKATGLTDIDLNTVPTLTTGNRGFSIKGAGANDIIGEHVGRLGDINGDGLNDIGFGGPLSNSYRGRAFIVYGSTTLSDIDLSITPSLSGIGRGIIIMGFFPSMMGQIITSAGDVNGDGISDILCASVGALGDRSRAYIIYGKSGLVDMDFGTYTLAPSQGYYITGFTTSKYLTYIGGTLGDINGDGLDDFFFVGYDLTWNGRGCILYGSASNPTNIDLSTITSLTATNQGFCMKGQGGTYGLGTIAGLGDINGDGLNDFIFQATKADTSDAFVMYGRTTGFPDITLSDSFSVASTAGFRIQGPAGSNFGGAMTYAVDINGDSSLDLIIGASQMFTSNGAVYIFFGPSPPPLVVPVDEIVNLSGLTDTLNAVSQGTFLAGIVLSIINFNNPGPVMLISLSDGLLFFKYLKILYSKRLQFMLDHCSPGNTLLDDLLSMPEALADKITKYSLPEKFEKYGDFHSSFLVNFWPALLKLSILGLFVIITWLLNPCFNSKVTDADGALKKLLYFIYRKARQAVKWNLILSMVTDSFGDLSLFTALEITTDEYPSFRERLSLVISVLSNIAGLFFLFKMFFIVRRLRKAKMIALKRKESRTYERCKQKLKDYEIVFECFKDESIFQQSFLLFFNIKMYIFYAIITYMPDLPLIQTIANSLIGLVMLGYIVIWRPFETRTDLYQCLFTELIFETIHICTLILAVTESTQIDFESGRILLGDIIIGCNTVFLGVSAIFLAIQLIRILLEILKFIRKKYLSKNNLVSDIKTPRNRDIPNVIENQRVARPPNQIKQHPNTSQSSSYLDYSSRNINLSDTSLAQRRNFRDYSNMRNNRLILKNNPRNFVLELNETEENVSDFSRIIPKQKPHAQEPLRKIKKRPKVTPPSKK